MELMDLSIPVLLQLHKYTTSKTNVQLSNTGS